MINDFSICQLKESQHSLNFQHGNKWLMRISPKGVFFNREEHPDWQPDDFAKAVIDILEKSYDVKFTPKDEPWPDHIRNEM